jgi:hypothetical protein
MNSEKMSKPDKMRLNFGYFHKYKELVIRAVEEVGDKIERYGIESSMVRKCIDYYDNLLLRVKNEMQEIVGNSDSLHTEHMSDLYLNFLALKCKLSLEVMCRKDG